MKKVSEEKWIKEQVLIIAKDHLEEFPINTKVIKETINTLTDLLEEYDKIIEEENLIDGNVYLLNYLIMYILLAFHFAKVGK